MPTIITHREQLAIQKLIETGYQQAATSLGQMVNKSVMAEAVTVKISKTGLTNPAGKLPTFSEVIGNDDQSVTVVTTDILGQAGGRSYLVLSERDCTTLQALCQTGSARVPLAEMQEAFVKEIDNVISAAVLTEFSNELGLQIYGGVPHSYTLSIKAFEAKMQEDILTEDGSYFLSTNTYFRFTDSARLKPQFFWKLSPEILRHMQQYATKSLLH